MVKSASDELKFDVATLKTLESNFEHGFIDIRLSLNCMQKMLNIVMNQSMPYILI